MNLSESKPRDSRLQTSEQKKIAANRLVQETKYRYDMCQDVKLKSEILIKGFLCSLELCNGYRINNVFTNFNQIKDWTLEFINERFKTLLGFEIKYKSLPEWRFDYIDDFIITHYRLYTYYDIGNQIRTFQKNKETGLYETNIIFGNDITKFIYIYNPLNVELYIVNSV